jgi:hypothetical protein
LTTFALIEFNEFCPNCGNFVNVLGENGFCADCGGFPQGKPKIFPLSFKKKLWLEKWLQSHAEQIESVMVTHSVSARSAIQAVASDTTARCILCNRVIEHGTYGRHFLCTRNLECRKARRFYKYLRYEKNLTKDAALTRVKEKYLK